MTPVIFSLFGSGVKYNSLFINKGVFNEGVFNKGVENSLSGLFRTL